MILILTHLPGDLDYLFLVNIGKRNAGKGLPVNPKRRLDAFR